MISVLPEWISKLSMQQQTVLLMALRGPDGFEKYHGCKRLLYFYRACVLCAADRGRTLNEDEHVATFMSMKCTNDFYWQETLTTFRSVEDALPLHYYTHLMHAAQILAYEHPKQLIRERWSAFYLQRCDYLHVEPESHMRMSLRLDDFGRPLGEVLTMVGADA